MTYNCHAFRKFFKNGDPITVDGVKAVYEYAEDDVLRISFPDKRSLAYTDIEHVPELDAKLAQEAMQLEAMLERGAVLAKPEEWGTLSPASGAVWVELTTETSGYYSFFGYVTVVGYPGQYPKFVFTVDDALQDHHAQLTLDYPILKGTGLFNGQYEFFNYIKNVYLLSGIVSQVDPYAVPYRITTRSDGYLPDMTDFTLMREGSVDDGWYSTVPIKAGRELARDETLSAFLVNRCDGEISRFAFTPQASELTAQKWPRAFAKYVADQGAPITAGAWDENNNFTTESGPLRLWSHAKYRAFSNAPFDSNLVQALACNDSFRLTARQTLCLQVRDLKTQALFENHFFSPTQGQVGLGWSKALCDQINRDSDLLRAGVLNSDCQVTPAEIGNAFWVPQRAELSVTLTVSGWWESRKVEGSQALPVGTTLHTWVFDAFSQRLLGHHQWSPTTTQRASGKWLADWATALNDSEVSAYVQASSSRPASNNLIGQDVPGLGLWHRGDALRIFTSLPDAGNWVPGPALELPAEVMTRDSLSVAVRHPFSNRALHTGVFRPPQTEAGGEIDVPSWRIAFARFLQEQAWPELYVDIDSTTGGAGSLSIPRFSELQVEFEPFIEETPDVQEEEMASAPSVEFDSAKGQLNASINLQSGELEFRLTQHAWDKGIRVAACEPTVFGKGEESPLWVSAGKIIWGGRVKQDYEIVLDYPESLRGEGKLIVGHFGAFDEHAFWKDSKSVEFTPSAALAPYTPRSLLCEDWGNTDHSEIFDTFGHDMTGVDGRLGLFHAHYPIATLQGLGARGPLCDLTLHYSALRGNEAGLGDGWAWRFSSLDVRDRVLTLANGGQITFTPEEWEDLGKQKPLKKKHCLLRCNKDYSEFTIELPNGRQEVLKKPAMEEVNEVEPNDEFRQTILKLLRAIKEKSKPQFPAVPEHWTQWVLLVASPAAYYVGAVLDYNEAAKAWETHGTIKELNERIAYYERPFVQLLPSRIISHYGEVLELTWKRQFGQFLLMRIESEQQPLFTAEYVTPDKSAAQVSMQIWPASDERFEVNLQLNDWLLRTLEWTQAGARLQQVKCGYEDDPVLDRVLCRLEELDGSVEYVRYTPGVRPEPKDTNKWPSWPKVELHALIPGGGQENHVATYQYSGELRDSSDQLYIIAGRRGPYGKRRHHLQVFGEDGRHRREILAGEASAEDQWLELKAQNKNTTQSIRYTGYGNDLIEVIESIKLVIRKGKPALACKHSVKHQQAIVEMLWRFSRNQREVLVNAIQACLQVVPVAQRQPHGKAVDMQITTTDDDGLPVKVIIEGQHTLYRGYYGRAGGANHIEADLLYIVDSLPELQELQELPLLDCPAVPEYAMLPVMYEYECDDFGHPLGLKLFGYRTVAHAGRPYLELAEERVIQGRRLQMEAGELFIPTDEPEQIGLASVLCRRHLHYSSTVTHKATPSDASKVKVWTVKNTQMTLQGPDVFWEETTKTFEDNPNAPYILERITSQTQAGTQQVSVRHFSRHSANWLTQTDSEIEMTRQYDALGRVVDDARYRLEPGRKSRAENQRAVIHITTAYSADNKLETHTHANGAQRRNHLDGVQRVWRSEWQPAGAIDYVPLDEYCRDGLDESQSVGCWEWDYLPGGQAVIEMAQVQPKDGREPWLTALGAVVEEQSSTNPTPPDVDSSEWDVDVALTCSGGDDEEEMLRFLTCLVQLRDMRDAHDVSDKDITDLIGQALHLLVSLFDNYRYFIPDFFKFFQGLAGRKGDQCIPVVGSARIPVRYGQKLERWAANLVIKGLDLDGADVENAEVLDFLKLLDSAEAERARGYLQIASSVLFTYANPANGTTTRLVVKEGMAQQCLSKLTTEYVTMKDGTFERTETLVDGAGLQQVKLAQQLDASAQVVCSERFVDGETRTYAFERDDLGRITKATRPDGSTVERAYHGFSNQLTGLKIDGRVIATQTVTNDSTLKSRTVGNRTYYFDDDTITLPDKTCLQTHIDADCVRWRAGDSAMASLARKNGGATVICEDGADGTWRHRFIQSDLPGRIEGTETTPRGKVPTHDWQTLCGATVASLRADGRWQRVFVDDQGRLLRTCKDHEDVLYRYDALGRLKSRLVHAMKAGEQWQVLSEHNGLGQEIVRTFLHNGAIRFSQRMTWRGDGRLISKANYQDGQLKSTERFAYDALDRLKGYTCESDDAAYCPTTASGDAVKAQAFIWDALDNIVTNVTTRFDGTQHTQDFSYDANADPTRMTSVQHGSQSRVLSWSDNGYLVDDGQGHAFSYTGTGQVSRVNDAEGQLLSRYQYDGHQRLVAQYVEQDESIRELRYDGDELIGEIWFDKTCAVTRRTSISAGLAEYEGDQVRWLIDDPQVGIAGQVRDGGLTLAPRLPFGEGALLEGVVSGYNGMRRDPVTGQYPAGNGYRSYDPGIGRYAQPDWLAPFGDGGHNPYQHCPDPVNLHDPSGAIMLSRWGQDRQLREREEQLRGTRNVGLGGKWRGLALSFVLTVLGVGATVFSGGAASMMLFAFLTTMAATSFGLEVAAALTAETNPELSKALGIASMATGVLSTLGFQGVMKASLKLFNATKSLVQRTVRWGGNGLKAVGRGFKRLKSAKLGVTRQSVWLSMREGASRAIAAVKSAPGKLLCKVDDYIKAPAARLEPMPTYGRHGVFGRLKSLWDGPDPLKLTGRSAAFYKWANQSRFVSTLSENMALAIEANILRGTIESSTALAWGNQTSTISARARGSYLSDLNIKEVARAVGQFEIRSTMELSI